MSRLKPLTPAPGFEPSDHFGRPVGFQPKKGRKLLLSFYRYASCPLCNIRVNTLISKHEALKASGLDMIGVFQSPAEEIRRYVGRQDSPFPIIPDPEMKLYRLYGVETGWAGLVGGGLRVAALVSAFRQGFLLGQVDGPINRLPADFLIDENGLLFDCYYGRDIGDHLPLAAIEAFAAVR